MRERRADGCKEGSEEIARKEGRKEGTCQEGRKEGRKEEEVTAVKSKGPRHKSGGPFFWSEGLLRRGRVEIDRFARSSQTQSDGRCRHS